MQISEHRRRVVEAEASEPAQSLPAPDLYEVLVECRDEEEQRELFERLRREGRRVKLLVL